MGGRGRGRGGPGLSFNAEAMGFGRGDAMPGTQLAPPPTFPPLDNQVRERGVTGGGDNIVVFGGIAKLLGVWLRRVNGLVW